MAKKSLNRWRGGGIAAVLIGALLLALLTGENALPARDEAKAVALPSDLAKVPSDSVLVVSGRIADLMSGELAKAIHQKRAKDLDEAAREFEMKFGLRPELVERFTMALLDPPPAREEPLLFLRTTKEYDRAKVLATCNNKEQKYKGHTFYGLTFYTGGKDWAVYLLDKQALVFGSLKGIHALIDHPTPKTEGNLAGAVRLAAGKHALTMGFNVKAFNDAFGDKLPDEAEPFKPLLQALSCTLTVDLAEQARTAIALTFPTEANAKAAMKPVQTGMALAGAALDQSVAEWTAQKVTPETAKIVKQLAIALKTAQVAREGKTLQASANLKVDVATTSLALVEAMRKVREANLRTRSLNNLRQITLGMHNYHDTFGRFPAHSTYDKNGKPMLSWRVMILPYIEQQDLYKQFHLNEPWDSEHNKQLLAKMPKIYASPSDETSLKNHATYYQGFVGKGTVFEGKKGISITDIPDGTSLTLMIVEAAKAVPWTKPEDIPYDASKPLPKLIRDSAKGFLASLCDGSVRVITNGITEKTLRNAITRNDGNPLGSDF